MQPLAAPALQQVYNVLQHHSYRMVGAYTKKYYEGKYHTVENEIIIPSYLFFCVNRKSTPHI
jgi:hypothetical protein